MYNDYVKYVHAEQTIWKVGSHNCNVKKKYCDQLVFIFINSDVNACEVSNDNACLTYWDRK